jgi:hypothetical protein
VARFRGQEWSTRSPDAIGAEATHRLDVLEEWVRDAKVDHSELYESRRLDSVHARVNPQSARSGAFATAARPLADFLRDVGAKPEVLELC